MLKLFKKDSQLEDKDHSLIGKIGENNEWEEIKTPSTVIARRSCHSSCIYKNKYLFLYKDCMCTEGMIAIQPEFLKIYSLFPLKIDSGKKYIKKENYLDLDILTVW